MTIEMTLRCPWCGGLNQHLDGPTPSSVPDQDSVAICSNCHRVSMFAWTAFGMTLRKPNEEEQREIEEDGGAAKAQEAMKAVGIRNVVSTAQINRWRDRFPQEPK